ncbi:MAG: hypothetical protein LBD11_05575 [Candidatus Peribacteria bacterium]|nr:hypothetical protein [Candidatus Peribacteria bacterium]
MDTSYFAYEWDTVPTKKTDQPYIVINITSTKFCPRLKEQLTPYITK